MSEIEKNIIRSYTDLGQAERVVNLGFDPNKTCDMCFIDNGDGYKPTLYEYGKVKKLWESGVVNCVAIFPCWSIMSLLHLCPYGYIEVDTRIVTSYLSDDGSCDYFDKNNQVIDNLIDCIEDLVERKYIKL
jgi:hypothetical protein